MSIRALMAFSVVLFIAAAAPEGAAKKELDKLQGTWVGVSGERDGQKLSTDQATRGQLIIKGDRYTVREGDKVTEQGTFKIDPTKKPMTLDVMPTEGEHKGMNMLGIYELEGDTLRACLAPSGKERPKEFSSKPGSGQSLYIMKREKP